MNGNRCQLCGQPYFAHDIDDACNPADLAEHEQYLEDLANWCAGRAIAESVRFPYGQ